MRGRTSLSIGKAWKIRVAYDGHGWWIEDAQQLSDQGMVRTVPPLPLGRERFASKRQAKDQASRWLRHHGFPC